MIDVSKCKSIFCLYNEGMGIREISRRLRVSINTVSKIINQKGEPLNTIRRDKIDVDPELLRSLL
jgi:transposase-like protein